MPQVFAFAPKAALECCSLLQPSGVPERLFELFRRVQSKAQTSLRTQGFHLDANNSQHWAFWKNDRYHFEMRNNSVLIRRCRCSLAWPARRLMPHTFCFGSVENTLQARRKQIPALKARNSKARGETPGLDGCGTSPARAAQTDCIALTGLFPNPCHSQGLRPGLCCAALSALGLAPLLA
jgi:hypothetical protein